MKRYFLATSLALGMLGAAHAGQASNDAGTHFQAIASGGLGILMPRSPAPR
ncbi:hypothetical protein [Polaromonas sp. YR568]|uniref:hypothetical protein n=1 Tax=Polaromonas sp. YR568 TaxID=1855301 RepID=UPI00398C1CA1